MQSNFLCFWTATEKLKDSELKGNKPLFEFNPPYI